MEFHAAPSPGRWVGLGLVLAGLVLAALLVFAQRAAGLGPVAATLLVLAAAAMLLTALGVYWVWGLWRLRYHLSRDGLIIAAPGGRHVVPMDEIVAVVAGRDYDTPLRGIRWPGFWHGRATVRDDEGRRHVVLVSATRPPAEQLLVMTPDLAYAISPASVAEFAEDFAMRRRMGIAQPLRQQTTGPSWLVGSLLGDATAKALVAGAVVLNVVAILWVVYRFPTLPAEVPLRFEYDAMRRSAVAVGLVPRANIWGLPLIGLAVAVLNVTLAWLVYRRARLAALLLLAGVVLAQLALLVMMGRALV